MLWTYSYKEKNLLLFKHKLHTEAIKITMTTKLQKILCLFLSYLLTIADWTLVHLLILTLHHHDHNSNLNRMKCTFQWIYTCTFIISYMRQHTARRVDQCALALQNKHLQFNIKIQVWPKRCTNFGLHPMQTIIWNSSQHKIAERISHFKIQQSEFIYYSFK